MPIPLKQLIEAQRPLEDRIVEFLARAPDQAFEPVEIHTSIEPALSSLLEGDKETASKLIGDFVDALRHAVDRGDHQAWGDER